MEIELETGNGEKKKLIRQDFAFTVISEFIEMLRQNFCIISSDKRLNPSALSIQTVKYQLSPQTTKSARSPRRVSPPLSFAARVFGISTR